MSQNRMALPVPYPIQFFIQFVDSLWTMILTVQLLIRHPFSTHFRISIHDKKTSHCSSRQSTYPHRFFAAFTPITLQSFESVWPQIVEDVKAESGKEGLPKEALEWLERSLNYNVVGGKCNRGMAVVDSVALLLGRDLTEEEFIRSATLGWMVELLQSFSLVVDDIMDASKTRRGMQCWYRRPEVGMIAINDAFMLNSAIYILLKKHFFREKNYANFVELFHTVSFQTELGQACDLLTASDIQMFSFDKYNFIVAYKTAYYSFYLPVALALYYTGRASEKNLEQARNILVMMGNYFQVQDDYLDNYADPHILGKIGTDIQDNKCSWLVNQALKRVSREQHAILKDNYGRKNKENETKIKALYNELRLAQVYQAYEEEQVGQIRDMINSVDQSEGLDKKVFEVFLCKIYKRSR